MAVIDLDAMAAGRVLLQMAGVPGDCPAPEVPPEVLFVASAPDLAAGSITLSLAFPGSLWGTVVNLDLFDARGQRVATLLRDSPVEGRLQRVNWSGRGEDGRLLDGVLCARLTTARGVQMLRFSLGEDGRSCRGCRDRSRAG